MVISKEVQWLNYGDRINGLGMLCLLTRFSPVAVVEITRWKQ
jgi:hypothetical protein